jgi:hypothetical protein
MTIESEQKNVKWVNIAGRGWGSDAALPREEAEVILNKLGTWVFNEKANQWEGAFRAEISTLFQPSQHQDGLRIGDGIEIGSLGWGGTLWVDYGLVEEHLSGSHENKR